MTETERLHTLQYIASWKRAAPILSAFRKNAIEEADTQEFVEAMDGMLENVFRENRPRLTTGLIEQQRWFAKLQT